MTIDELIAALEKADGPSADLDERIARCVFPSVYAAKIGGDWHSASGIKVRVHDYTASIDSALTLVPDRFDWYVSSEFHGTKWFATVTSKDRLHHFVARGVLSSPAIALCIAALNARKP